MIMGGFCSILVLDSFTQCIVMVPFQKGEKRMMHPRAFLKETEIVGGWGGRRRTFSQTIFLETVIREVKGIPFCMRVIAFDRR